GRRGAAGAVQVLDETDTVDGDRIGVAEGGDVADELDGIALAVALLLALAVSVWPRAAQQRRQQRSEGAGEQPASNPRRAGGAGDGITTVHGTFAVYESAAAQRAPSVRGTSGDVPPEPPSPDGPPSFPILRRK